MQFLIDNGAAKWFAGETAAKKAEQQGLSVTPVYTPEHPEPPVVQFKIISTTVIRSGS